MPVRVVLVIFVLVLAPRLVNADLIAHVELSQTGQDFSYTLFNDEPLTSSNNLSTWHLDINAPFIVLAAPASWDYFTDNTTYIDWFNTEFELPYPHDVAPGESLSGFTLQSTVATSALHLLTIGSWDHNEDTSGPSFEGQVSAPSVPEPSSGTLLGMSGIFVLAAVYFRQFRAARAAGVSDFTRASVLPLVEVTRPLARPT